MTGRTRAEREAKAKAVSDANRAWNRELAADGWCVTEDGHGCGVRNGHAPGCRWQR